VTVATAPGEEPRPENAPDDVPVTADAPEPGEGPDDVPGAPDRSAPDADDLTASAPDSRSDAAQDGAPDPAPPELDSHDDQDDPDQDGHDQDGHDQDGHDEAAAVRSSGDIHDDVADAGPGTTTDDGPGAGSPRDEPDPESEPDVITTAIRRVPAAGGRHGAPAAPPPGGLRALGNALRPRANRSQVVVGVLCALLGFALVAQVSQTQEDQLSSLRQSDLVRLLDDVTQRSGELEDQLSSLEATRDELRSGTGRERAALEVAEQQAETLGILSGRLPAQGPGVVIEVVEGEEPLQAFSLFNVLEELRNAGAEAMEVNGVRLVANSYFEDTSDGVVVDGQVIASPYRWVVIGDPSTLETALEIPGGAMASLRAEGARTTIRQEDLVEVTATVEPGTPQFATPVPADE
jgi:uncharacterized protein YlxW (UPF0749 family)